MNIWQNQYHWTNSLHLIWSLFLFVLCLMIDLAIDFGCLRAYVDKSYGSLSICPSLSSATALTNTSIWLELISPKQSILQRLNAYIRISIRFTRNNPQLTAVNTWSISFPCKNWSTFKNKSKLMTRFRPLVIPLKIWLANETGFPLEKIPHIWMFIKSSICHTLDYILSILGHKLLLLIFLDG